MGGRNSNSLSSKSKINQIKYLRKQMEEVYDGMDFGDFGGDVILFYGPTKSGKSTLLNVLLGNNLIAIKHKKSKTICIQLADVQESGPDIGNDSSSKTSFPTKWISPPKLTGYDLWDCPGNEDNRGPIIDILNMTYIHNLLVNVNSAKIVLTVDFNDIKNDNIRSFVSFLTSLETTFKDRLTDCFPNIAVVFTKVPETEDGDQITVDYINDLLQYKILPKTSLDMSESCRKLIEHLTKNCSQIGIFRKVKDGPIPNDIDANVINVLQSIGAVRSDILKTAVLNISSSSKEYLFTVKKELISSHVFRDLEKSIKDHFNSKINVYRNVISSTKTFELEQLLEMSNELKDEVTIFKNNLESVINGGDKYHDKLKVIKCVFAELKNKIEVDKLIEKSKIIEFIDKVLDSHDSTVINDKLYSLMKNALLDTKQITNDVNSKIRETNNAIAKKILAEEMQKKNDEIKKLNEKMSKMYDCIIA